SRSQPATSSRKASSAALKVSFMMVSSIQQQAGNQLALCIAVTQVEFAGLGPLEIQMHIVFPGKAHTAVQLEGAASIEEQRVRAIPLGHGRRFRQLGSQLAATLRIDGFLGDTGGVVHRRAGYFTLELHVGRLVLERLEAGNRPTELHSLLHV